MTSGLRVCLDLTPNETVDRWGGIGRYGSRLLEEFLEFPAGERRGIELHVLTASDRDPVSAERARDEDPARGPVIHASLHRRRRAWRIGAGLRRERIDLFHSLRVSPLPRAPGCRVVATCYDIVHSVLPRRPGRLVSTIAMHLERMQQMVLHRRPHHLIAISGATAEDLRGVLGIPSDRISVIPLGVDAGRFSPVPAPEERAPCRERYGLPDRFYVCVGSDHYRKNQLRLFDAWRAAAAQGIPEGLVFVGRGLYGDVRERLSGIAASEGLAGRVVWPADVADEALAAFYRQATALVAPSLHEGFGLTVLEAMACGTPVAAARAGSLPEVGGEAALYFDPLDHAGLTEVLVRLSTDDALRDMLRSRGLERVRQFSWKSTAERTWNLYARLLGMGSD